MPLSIASVLIPTRRTRRAARRPVVLRALAMVALAALAWRLTT